MRLNLKPRLVLIISILMYTSCNTVENNQTFYVGTYTNSGSRGIYAFTLGNAGIKPLGLVAETLNPTFLVLNSAKDRLYCINETDSFKYQPTGSVSVFEVDKHNKQLRLIQQLSSLGSGPAHLSFDKTEKFLMVANYGGGNAAIFPINTDGTLSERSAFIQNSGTGPNLNRQSGPHAHYIGATPDNKFVMIADLGTDSVFTFKFYSDKGTVIPVTQPNKYIEPGSGPRHLAFHPNNRLVYILNELTSSITVCKIEGYTGVFTQMQQISALPDSFIGSNTSAEIAIDAKGNFLYVSNRGADNIGVFQIDSLGNLNPVEWVSCGGEGPRHFTFDPSGSRLLVANQITNNMVLFAVDPKTGRLKQLFNVDNIDSPVCIVF